MSKCYNFSNYIGYIYIYIDVLKLLYLPIFLLFWTIFYLIPLLFPMLEIWLIKKHHPSFFGFWCICSNFIFLSVLFLFLPIIFHLTLLVTYNIIILLIWFIFCFYILPKFCHYLRLKKFLWILLVWLRLYHWRSPLSYFILCLYLPCKFHILMVSDFISYRRI